MDKIEVIKPSELDAGQKELWQSWQAADEDFSSPYFHPQWAAHVGAVRKDVRIGVFLDGAGREKGFLPFQRPSRHCALPAGGPLCDYQGVIAAPRSHFNAMDILAALDVGRFDFANLLVKQSPFAPFARHVHVSHIIDMGKGHEAYITERREHGSSESKRARKRARKMAREQGALRLVVGDAEQNSFDRLIAWKTEQYHRTGQPDIFLRPWARDLVNNIFASRDADFGGVLFSLYAGDRLVALNFCLRAGPVLHCWFIAHDPAFSHYSPGLILFEEILAHMEGMGCHTLDLGAGDYRFKRNLANTVRPLCGGFVGGKALSAQIRRMEYAVRWFCEALPLGPLSALPGKAMRRADLLGGLKT